ncbi:MAG: tetratricopeptide repeat protein [Bacteroidota bacterium]
MRTRMQGLMHALSGGCILLFAVAGLLLVHADAVAQGKGDERLAKAIDSFNAGDFEGAIRSYTEIAGDKSLDKPVRREAMLGLGRSYFAKNNKEKAKEALGDLLDLEPPLVELNPDEEAPPLMKLYYAVRREKQGNMTVERADPGIKTIAVLDFKNRSVDDKEKFDPMEKGFSELMINQLRGAVQLKVIERERIGWIMDEIGLENTPGKFDVASAVRVGKQLGVHAVVLGSFIKFKGEMWLGARLVKVETSEIIATEDVKGDADDFFDLAEKLSVKVAKGVNVNITEAQVEKGTETKSLDAMMAYSEGLVLVEKGDYDGAVKKFEEALQKDPTYDKARIKAQSLKPLLRS